MTKFLVVGADVIKTDDEGRRIGGQIKQKSVYPIRSSHFIGP